MNTNDILNKMFFFSSYWEGGTTKENQESLIEQ